MFVEWEGLIFLVLALLLTKGTYGIGRKWMVGKGVCLSFETECLGPWGYSNV